MKIAIKANPSRGKEIISLLENLGSVKTDLCGDGELYTYYIDENNVIRYNEAPKDYKVYTLEEFEKEFPFKIGDEVTIVGLPYFPKIITKMAWDCDEILYSFEGLNNSWFGAKSLKKFEMKEERNITLTLDKAKEWYKKGGELREIALQAFTEEELTKIDLPKTWEEFLKVFPYSDSAKKAVKIMTDLPLRFSYQYEALLKLNYLRDYYVDSYKGRHITDYYIYRNYAGFYNTDMDTVHHTLSFPSKHLADEFLKNFKDLINNASYLIA